MMDGKIKTIEDQSSIYKLNCEEYRSSYQYNYNYKSDISLFINNMIGNMNALLNYDEMHDHLIELITLFTNKCSFFTVFQESFDEYDKVSDLLLKYVADPNMPDGKGVYPLAHAINLKSEKFALSLINSNKIDYSIPINCGNRKSTYLHYAVEIEGSYESDYEILSELHERNLIDVNVTDSDGNTLLMIECEKG